MHIPESIMFRPFEFVTGLLLPFRAAGLIFRTPALLFYSIIPIAVAFLVSSFLVGFGFHELHALLNPWLEHFASMVGVHFISVGLLWIFKIILAVLLFIIALLLFVLLANLAALPFNDLLSKKTETCVGNLPAASEPFSLSYEIKLLILDFKKNILALLCFLILLLTTLIPGLNLFVIPLTWLLIAFQFLSYPQTRRGIGIAAGLKYLKDNIFICLGFGLVITAGMAIPILNLLLVPVAVVAATLLQIRNESMPPQFK